MSNTWQIIKSINCKEEQIDELEEEILDLLGELKEAMLEEGEEWEGSEWQEYRMKQGEKVASGWDNYNEEDYK